MIEKRKPDDVATVAAEHLRTETKHEMVKWLIRAGLGRVEDHRQQVDTTAEEEGSLFVFRFDPATDPLHDDLRCQLEDWASEPDE